MSEVPAFFPPLRFTAAPPAEAVKAGIPQTGGENGCRIFGSEAEFRCRKRKNAKSECGNANIGLQNCKNAFA